jgi:hypothetical protein
MPPSHALVCAKAILPRRRRQPTSMRKSSRQARTSRLGRAYWLTAWGRAHPHQTGASNRPTHIPCRLPTLQWKSPFDTCPCTTSPVSLTNLQVSVGGQNVLQSTLQYGYEFFLEQANLCEQLTSSDFGISTGLINQNYWENSKWYFVNVERGNAADKLNGLNINVSLTNNSNVPIEVMVFIFCSDEIAIDIKTGLETRHKN